MTARHSLDQIVRGLDGVTPGEWLNEGSAIYALDEGGMANRFYAGVQGGFVKNRRHGAVRTSEAELKANAEHIARCSPDAIREIAAYVRDLEERLEKAAEALEPFKNYAEDEWTDHHGDETPVLDEEGEFIAKLGDFRRARKALSTPRTDNGNYK